MTPPLLCLPGFYDLYKNVPHFKSLVITAFRPAAYLFEWLELHTQARLRQCGLKGAPRRGPEACRPACV